MNATCPDVPPSYLQAVNALTPLLRDLPPKLVAIDGRDGSGKTTLGRYLAWCFNVSLIETDLFLEGRGRVDYRVEKINRIIEMRLKMPRPVIVEGIALLRLLEKLRRHADFLIYVHGEDDSGSFLLDEYLTDYEKQYDPRNKADFVATIPANIGIDTTGYF